MEYSRETLESKGPCLTVSSYFLCDLGSLSLLSHLFKKRSKNAYFAALFSKMYNIHIVTGTHKCMTHVWNSKNSDCNVYYSWKSWSSQDLNKMKMSVICMWMLNLCHSFDQEFLWQVKGIDKFLFLHHWTILLLLYLYKHFLKD